MSIQTIAYFNEEVCRFRKMMGDKSFWKKPIEQRELAIKGLGYVYLTISKEDGSALSKEENEQVIMTFQTTMDEYNMRENMLLFGNIGLDSVRGCDKMKTNPKLRNQNE